MKETSGEVGIYSTPVKDLPQKIGVATEIVSISVSAAELIVLLVLGTVSTSVMVFSVVRQCQHKWKWIERA